MHTDFDKQSGQRRPILLVSGVAVAVCLFVAAVFGRRRSADGFAPQATGHADAYAEPVVANPVWEGIGLDDPDQWSHVPASFAASDEAQPYDVEYDAEVEVEPYPVAYESSEHEVEVEVDVEAWQPGGEPQSEVAEPELEQPAPADDHWFGSFAPSGTWEQQRVETPYVSEAPHVSEPTADHDAVGHEIDAEDLDPAVTAEASADVEDEPVIELPPVADASEAAQDPKRLPPPRLRRFMGTGATVLVIGMVLVAGVMASGATADSTSDPATVPDAVGTTSPLADTTTGTTSTDTTATDTTTTDTTSTATTTTDTTTTSTTDTTTTSTTPTDTTATTTTPTDTTTTATTPVAPPASDPATTPVVPVTPDPTPPPAVPATPAVDPAPPTTPGTTVTPSKPKTTPKHHAVKAPAKAVQDASPSVGAPSASGAGSAAGGPPVVTLASGADPIGSILSANSVIPAVDAALLPTPAQVSFYVKASKPLAALPTLGRIDHPVAARLVAAGRRGKVGWTLLAAVARLESNLGARPGLFAGRHLATTPTGDGLTALAGFLRAHGASKDPLAPVSARKALTLYYGGSTRMADRAIALAALYGALGSAGLQHGVRAETALLQRRVLADRRVHLTVAGRSDIRHGRVDPRVLVTLEYLANSFRKVGVSDLVSGGALFSRSGSVSAHLYGRAVDVSSLHGKVVKGHQGPGTMTEQAIRKLLLLPKSLRPRQVISLMDVDGPTGNHGSFALPDHYDRIQIDY